MKKKILNLNVWLVAFTCLFIATSCKNKPAEVNRQTYATKKVEGKTDKTITTSFLHQLKVCRISIFIQKFRDT